jgi:hypothetical protein
MSILGDSRTAADINSHHEAFEQAASELVG